MHDHSNIKAGADVIGADSVHVGTVDHIDGERIKLSRKDSGDGKHHWIAADLVAGIEGDRVRLSAKAEVAVTFEEDS